MASPPEDAEFRKALRGVKALREHRRAELRRAQPTSDSRQSEAVSLDEVVDSDEELAFIRNGYSRDILRKLRRGYWVVEDHLDLHGMNRLEAVSQTERFLKKCVKLKLRCVRIVHGRGLGSYNREPVLKAMLRKWLPLREEILAFSQAPAAQGGSRAVLLLLRSRP